MSALDSWLRNVQASGAAERTVTAYAAVTNSFYSFLVESGLSTEEPTFTTMQAYRDHLFDRGLSPVSVRYHLVVLRSFSPTPALRNWARIAFMSKTPFPST